MEHNVNINFNEIKVKVDLTDLITAAKIFRQTPTSGIIPEEITAEPPTIKDKVLENKPKDVNELSDTETVKNEYPGFDSNAYDNYEQFKHMKSVLSKLSEGAANELVKQYSTNQSTDVKSVPPNAWGKVIAEASDLMSTVKKQPEQKTYTLEEVREVARAVQLKHGKETLEAIFKGLGHAKLSEFKTSDYAELYAKLKEVE